MNLHVTSRPDRTARPNPKPRNCSRGVLLYSWGTRQYVFATPYTSVPSYTLKATATAAYSDPFSICFTDTYDYIYDEDLGNYVTTETDYGEELNGLLRASAYSVYGPREKFTFACTVDYCYIYSHANFRYVAAEVSWLGDNRGMLRARTLGKDFGPWEKFN